MSEEFLDDLRGLPQKNLAAELLERLMRDSIRSKLRTNVVQETKFSERLAGRSENIITAPSRRPR
jgi:type I restriction enzyme R subunit